MAYAIKIPFILMVDAAETETVDNIEKIWSVVEEYSDLLTDKRIFFNATANLGYIYILRTCNTILRKLSKSCNLEVVLTFLCECLDNV